MGKPYRPKDHFFKKAKEEGLRARSAFKIDEIARRFQVLRRGAKVLDLGAAPGGFLQVVADAVGESGLVVGVDLVAIRSLGRPQVKTAVLDVFAPGFDAQLEQLWDGQYDAVISDMAPKTTGIRSTDEARSVALVERAVEIADRRAKVGATFIAKLFMGGDFEAVRRSLRDRYAEVKIVRPEATRARSVEVYLVALNKR